MINSWGPFGFCRFDIATLHTKSPRGNSRKTICRRQLICILLLLNMASARAAQVYEESSRMTLPDRVRHQGTHYSSSPCGNICETGTIQSTEGVGPHPQTGAEDNL